VVIPKAQTGLRLDEETLRKIIYIAKHQKRLLNAQIEFAVQEAIEKFELAQGKIPPVVQL
jgi:hypothetical protein